MKLSSLVIFLSDIRFKIDTLVVMENYQLTSKYKRIVCIKSHNK